MTRIVAAAFVSLAGLLMPMGSEAQEPAKSCWAAPFAAETAPQATEESYVNGRSEVKRHSPQELRFRLKQHHPDGYWQAEIFALIEKEWWSEFAICTPKDDGGFECGIECDGGGFNILTAPDGALTLKPKSWGFRVVPPGGGCGGEVDRSVYVKARPDEPAIQMTACAPES